MGFCQLPYPMMLFCFLNVARLKLSKQPPKLDMLVWSCWILCWDLPPPPKATKITHQQKGSLCIFSFSFRDLSNLKVVTSQDAPRGEGLGWDYRSSKNTTLLVVTRQHPGGGGVHIYPPRERENISNLWKKKIIDSEVTAGNLIC